MKVPWENLSAKCQSVNYLKIREKHQITRKLGQFVVFTYNSIHVIGLLVESREQNISNYVDEALFEHNRLLKDCPYLA